MKRFYTLFLILSTFFLSAQVGIGTISPRGALDINEPTTNDKGLVLPANDFPSHIINPQSEDVVPGTIFFDKTEDCIKVYRKHKTGGTSEPGWSNCIGYSNNIYNGGDNNNSTSPIFSNMNNTCTAISGIVSTVSFTHDPVRPYLSSSLSTYDAATVGDLVYITKEEYEKMSEASKKLGILSSSTATKAAYNDHTVINYTNKYESFSESANPKVNVFAFAARSPVAQDIVFKLFADIDLNITSIEKIGVVWRSNRIPIREGDNYLVFKKSAASFNYTAKNKNSNKKAKLILGYYATNSLYTSNSSNSSILKSSGDNTSCSSYSSLLKDTQIPEISALYFVE